MITKQAAGSAGFFNKPPKKVSDIVDNAHSGSPFVIPWVPQLRRQQPNERIKTFSKKATPATTGTTVAWSVNQVTGSPSK